MGMCNNMNIEFGGIPGITCLEEQHFDRRKSRNTFSLHRNRNHSMIESVLQCMNKSRRLEILWNLKYTWYLSITTRTFELDRSAILK